MADYRIHTLSPQIVRLVHDRMVSIALARVLYVGESRITRKNLMLGKRDVREGIWRRIDVDLKRYGCGGFCERAYAKTLLLVVR